ncbi:MFS transporter [Microlunatus spumicola]|uniref:MFS transporter n=1 Tax=Microlunatus spumicola TaxID=81499 RepID=A0ABP6X7Z1_9ACTN
MPEVGADARAGRAWLGVAPAMFMVAWGGNHFSPLLLLYRQVEGYSAVQVDLFFAFYVLGLAPGFLLTGPVSDRVGRRPLVVAALVLSVVGSVVLGLGSASPFALCAGRFVSGVSVAVAMVAGTTWVKELSAAAAPGVRARRAALTLTVGFGLGAAVAGGLAQWGPAPTLLPYGVQLVLALLAAVPLARSPETRPAGAIPRHPFREELSLPPQSRARFRRVVVPMAPWVFGAPALAFVVGPALVADRTGSYRIAYAALAAVVTLACGAGVQPFVPRLARLVGGRQAVLGLLLTAVATLLLAVDVQLRSVTLALVAAALLGTAYGICILTGLVETQALADPERLAAPTGVYYSLIYVGFLLPVVLSELTRVAPEPVLLVVVAAVCAGCAVVVARGLRTTHPA